MYTAFFGLREKPFALSPDPRFLFLSAAHREALAHLLYGIEQGEGFIAVTGEVGTGKTTLCRTLLRRLGPEVEVAFLFNPKLSARELIEAILVELGLEKRGESVRELIASLNHFLLERRQQGRRVLLIIDEAQGLAPDTLEQIRLLSNLETETEKLIQILLLGQPELDAMLESEDLRQLRQRIAVRWRLAPLSRGETADYVRHRLRVSAQAARDHVFPDPTLREVFRYSRGVPRVVNLLCDRALLAAYADGSVTVAPDHVARAVRETGAGRVTNSRARAARRQLAFAAAAAAALGVAAAGIWQLGRHPFAATPAAVSGPSGAGSDAGTAAAAVSVVPVSASPVVEPPSASAPRAAPPADPVERPAGAVATPAVSESPEASVPAAASLAVSGTGELPAAADPPADPEAPVPASEPGAAAGEPAGTEPADVSAPPPAAEPSAALLAPQVPALADASSAAPASSAPARVDDLAHALALRSPGAVAADALASMFDAWSVRDAGPMPAVIAFPDVMAELQAHGLAVVSIPDADVERLRTIGHPALLVVSAEDRVPRLVALRRLVGDQVELRGVVANAPALVSAAELERRWSGETYVVWREFEPLPAYLRVGDAGAGVSWLQRALAELGFSSKPPSGVFDGATEDAVRAFQADHRLEPDGTVGPLTKMSIYQALGRYGVPAVGGGGAG